MRITIEIPDADCRQMIAHAETKGIPFAEWASEALTAELRRERRREGHAAVRALIGKGHVADNWREELRAMRKEGGRADFRMPERP